MAIDVLITYGTRPEAIKFAPLIKKIQSDNAFNLKICNTGQHLELLDQVNTFFDIKPDFNLELMSNNQTLNVLSSKLQFQFDNVINQFKPQLVLVQGDTTTSFIVALASFYNKIPVGHVEAGLRSHNLDEPFPEEGNRTLTSRIATMHFAPTERNVANLINEGINSKSIFKTGNTVVDALQLTLELLKIKGIPDNITWLIERSKNFDKLIVITTHRRENFGTGIINICEAIKYLASIYKDSLFVIPVHPNPNVKTIVLDLLGNISNIILTESLEYQSMIYLLSKSYFVLTDSGGVQEEAPSLGKPVLVLRNVTERQEAVDAGCVKLI